MADKWAAASKGKLGGASAPDAAPKGKNTEVDTYDPSKHTKGALDIFQVAPFFGRIPISKAEIEAVESGGATKVY